MKNSLMLLSFFLTVTACQNSTEVIEEAGENKIEYSLDTKLNWLIGTWENSNIYGTMTESWSKENDSTYKGFMIASGNYLDSLSGEMKSFVDTLEEVTLEERHQSIFYIPAVRDQNNGLPIKFRMILDNDSVVQFNNPEHDFPQTITYTKIGNDSIRASISGNFQGQFVEEFFPFKRK